MKISVLGAGTWGTALAILLSNNGHEVILWSALEREVQALNHDRNNVPNLPEAIFAREYPGYRRFRISL